MDEGTYWSRVNRIFNLLDVRTIFIKDEEIKHAVEVIKRRERDLQISKETGQPLPSYTPSEEKEYQRALKIKETTLHPDTNEKIFLPLRVSCIIPVNMCLDLLMLSANSFRTTIAAQWLNQTYNALHYWANRNATNTETATQVFQAYCGATTAALVAALGINAMADKLLYGRVIYGHDRPAAPSPSASPRVLRYAPILKRLAPFGAVAAADIVNLAIMRRNEYIQGINVYDVETGELIVKSKRAGFFAVSACIIGRVGAAAPILVIPPLIMHVLSRGPRAKQRPRWVATAQLLAMVGLAIQISVPLTFGLFRQTARVRASLLEPEVGQWRNSLGREVRMVTYNKGI